MAKKAATPATVTLKHLAAAIAEDQELSKKQAESILNDVVTMITKHLKKGERIRIVGLGILQVRKRAARMGRNPATGAYTREVIEVTTAGGEGDVELACIYVGGARWAQSGCPAYGRTNAVGALDWRR